jgi:hypothetical protein
VRAGIDQVQRKTGFVDITVVVFTDPPKGLDADGEFF